MVSIALLRTRALHRHDRYPAPARRPTLAELLRYARPGLPCNRQTIRRAQPRATRSSLEVARGDGARPCPPKAPPLPPPRDLVQRAFSKFPSVRLPLRLPRCKDRTASAADTCPAPKLPNRSNNRAPLRRQ